MNVSATQGAYLQRLESFAQSAEEHILVANALNFIIHIVFPTISNTFVLTVAASAAPVKFLLNDIISKLFANWGFVAVELVAQANEMERYQERRNYYCNLILIDSFESLESTDLAKHNQNRDSLEYYYIFLHTDDKYAVKEMTLIFKYCFDNYWLHCNVMVYNSIGEILVYTYFPFKENNCFQTQPEIINQFKGDRFISDEIFPDKLNNLKGCPLKLTTWETPPFVVNKTAKRYQNYNVTGCEMIIISTISESMNFTLNIELLLYNINDSPDYGLLTKLQNYETNITLGFFRRTNERDEKATPTSVTYFVPLIALILRKQTSHKSMGILTYPFDGVTWILTIVVFAIVGIMDYLQSKKFQESIFQTFEIVIGVTTKDMPKKTSSRVRFMTTLFSSLMLRSIYQSSLFYGFSFNFYISPPFTLNGLATSGYKVVSTILTKQFLLYVPQIENKTLPLIVTNSSSEMSPIRYIEYHRNESLVAISIIEFAMRYVREELLSDVVLRILPINVKDQQVGYYLTKHSYLVDRFNSYILRLHQSGLIGEWREWANADFKVTQRTVSATAYDSTFIIKLEHFAGFIFLMIFLHVMSIILFALELWSQKAVCLKRIF